MAVHIQSINADSCFLLSFSPSGASLDETSFNILLDPWLSGPSTILSERFAHTLHTARPCIDSLLDLPRIDLVLVSQDMPDHCHEPTLRQLPRNTTARVVAPPAPAKRIQSWKHFDASRIHTLRRYQPSVPESVARFPIFSTCPSGSDGEITISYLAPKRDLKGLHNAIGITYRPCGGRSVKGSRYVDLPLTPPMTPTREVNTTLHPSPTGLPRGKTMSILYSPHGIDYDCVRPYASSHLLKEAALPLDVLLHSRHRVSNAWFFGGLICNGSPGGITIAQNLGARHWVAAHDEDKVVSGISTKTLKIEKYGDERLARLLEPVTRCISIMDEKQSKSHTAVHDLDAGQTLVILPR